VEKKTINFVVLNARSKKEFEQAWPSFRQLVLSYQFMGDHVTVETKNATDLAKPAKKH
jgi:hypothetical protein